jgi:hypothetical protein
MIFNEKYVYQLESMACYRAENTAIHPYGVQGVASSNPAVPTISNNGLQIESVTRFLFLTKNHVLVGNKASFIRFSFFSIN